MDTDVVAKLVARRVEIKSDVADGDAAEHAAEARRAVARLPANHSNCARGHVGEGRHCGKRVIHVLTHASYERSRRKSGGSCIKMTGTKQASTGALRSLSLAAAP
eukprot:6205752-Pleurochrysis_carterae.AAC.1